MKEEEIRLKLEDTSFDAIHKLSKGNPGAVMVCMDIMENTAKIDPDSFIGGLGTLLSLDQYHIYESRIWMLYKDVCGENLIKLIAVLRACDFGFLNIDNLNHAIDNYGDGIDVNAIKEQVRKRLPTFGMEKRK